MMVETLQEAFTKREEFHQDKLQKDDVPGYPTEVLKKVTKGECVPSSVKRRFIRDLKGRIAESLSQLRGEEPTSKSRGRLEAEIVRYIYALEDIVIPMTECDPQKDAKMVIDSVTKN